MYIGIDIGSSYIKSSFLDVKKNIVSDVSRVNSPDFLPNMNPGAKEYMPSRLFNIVKREIDQRMGLQSIDGILIATQMHGFVLTDESGRNLTNYISWQDERAMEMSRSGFSYSEELSKTILPHLKRRTGTTTKLNLSICPLYYMSKNMGLPGNARFMMMGDYIVSRLTGVISKCHISNAASTGMVNIGDGTWSREIAKIVGATNLYFPEVAMEVEEAGEYKGAKIYTAVGDQQASLLGGGEYDKEDLLINIATGTQVSIVSDKLMFGRYETRPFFDGKYLLCDPDVPSGRNFDTIINFIYDLGLKIFDQALDSQYMWRKIGFLVDHMQAPRVPLAVDLDFYGLDGRKGGYIQNIAPDNFTIESIILGAFYSLCENLYRAAFKVADINKVRRIVLTGGLVRNTGILPEMIERRFGLKCVQSETKEESLTGLLKIAAKL
jgi:sugar (pentulose or hexulose) kinase